MKGIKMNYKIILQEYHRNIEKIFFLENKAIGLKRGNRIIDYKGSYIEMPLHKTYIKSIIEEKI